MFETKTKSNPLLKRIIKAQGKPEQDNPAITFGQGDKNKSSLVFFYKPLPPFNAKSN